MISTIFAKAWISALLGLGAIPYFVTNGEPDIKKPNIGVYLKNNWWKLAAGAAAVVLIMSQLNILKKR